MSTVRYAGLSLVLLFFLSACTAEARQSGAEGIDFDLVLEGGRVIDPETGLDAVRNVGVRDGVITAVTEDPLQGRRVLDARGLVVAPGFIDLHAHGQTPENYRQQVLDGVTSALELEVGADDVAAWYSEREGGALVNYGVSAGHIPARMTVLEDPGDFLPRGDAAQREATPAERDAIVGRIEDGLREGAVAVGMGLQYTPGASREEVMDVFGVAGAWGVPVHVHLRYMGLQEPDNSLAALEEVLANSALTGAPLHVVHIHSSGLGATPRLLDMIEDARTQGMDVTTEVYPYTAGMTGIESAVFDEGWQQVLGIGYRDLQWAATGERLDSGSFRRYREEGGFVILHFIPVSAMEAALASPLAMIASDGRLQDGRGHPRSSGTYSRVLGRLVREEGLLTLSQAIERMSLMPARRLEARVPEMRRKGRVQGGADADLVAFDPDAVNDRATYEDPDRHSTGIFHVLIRGVPVVADGALQHGVHPGRAIRAPRGNPSPDPPDDGGR